MRPRGRAAPATLLGLVALLLLLTSALIELADAEPRAELWVGAVAGVLFLLAVPFVRGNDSQVLAGRARLLVGAGTGAVLAVIGLWQATEQPAPRVLLLLIPAGLLFATAVLAVRGALLTGRALRVTQLRAQLAGQEEERRRWVQELHDETLQNLAAIEVRLGGLTRSSDPQAVAAGLEDSRRMVREQIRTLRHLITQMRPLALDSLGLAAALQDLAARAEETGGLPVHCDVRQLPTGLTASAQVSIYRIAQEALTNALRHSACHLIELCARVDGEVLELTVLDDGIGIEPAGRRSPGTGAAGPGNGSGTGDTTLGRLGMAQRAEAIGADLSWLTPSDGGTLVRLRARLDRVSG